MTDKDRLQQALLDLDLQSAEEEKETQEHVATCEIEIQEREERIGALGREQGEREEALRVAKEEVKECDRKILEMEAGVDEAIRRMENLRVSFFFFYNIFAESKGYTNSRVANGEFTPDKLKNKVHKC